jgi:hypothetical protein
MRVLILALLGLLTQEDLQRRRDTTAARVEELRGLAFKAPLAIRAGTRREYAAFAIEKARRVYGGDLAAAEKSLKTLGLLPPTIRMELALTAHAGLGVKAFCSKGEILLLDPATPDDLLLNKMTLGLLDQHFEPGGAATYDAQMALAALRMGDAELTKHLFWHQGRLPEGHARKAAEEAADWEKGASTVVSAVLPRIFVRTADFPWRRGAAFAAALYAEGGLARLNRAYAEPPPSTEHILHPEKHLKNERPVEIDLGALDEFLSARGYRAVHRSVLGELGTALVLETHFPREDLAAASEGWGGDALVLYEKDGQPPLVAWATDWDTEKDASEFSEPATRLTSVLSGSAGNLLVSTHHRKTSVALLVNIPKEMHDDLVEALWKCTRRRDKTEPYGR